MTIEVMLHWSMGSGGVWSDESFAVTTFKVLINMHMTFHVQRRERMHACMHGWNKANSRKPLGT